MIFDLTESQKRKLESLPSWDFSIRVGGKAFPTVRPSIALIESLVKMAQEPKGFSVSKSIAIFADPKPDAREWYVEIVSGAVASYLAYLKSWMAQCSEQLVKSTHADTTAQASAEARRKARLFG
jgi:hypothetical protein